MGQPPMGGPGGPPPGPPMGGPPVGQTARRGTSKAVPIVVSAGLAVGVFCGLLFGVGKKSEAVAAGSSTAATVAKDEPSSDKAAPAGVGASDPVTPATTTTPTPTAGTGSAAPAAGSTSATASPTLAVENKTIKLTVTVKPDRAADDAKLIIDGEPVDGMSIELPADKKSVKVEIKSSGYRSVDKKIDLAGGDTAVEFEMAKRSSGSSTPQVRPPKRPDRPPSGGGGLIDI
jgi:hypothetical protein